MLNFKCHSLEWWSHMHGIKRFEKALVVVSFLIMIIVNILAEVLPINGITTPQVSNSYPSLLTPAPYTFTIWGLIYILLLFHVLYLIGVFKNTIQKIQAISKIELLFSLSSVANACWMLSWHFGLIPLSFGLIVVILILLAVITDTLSSINISKKEKILACFPFSIYFGWITVATLANGAIFLISTGFTKSPIPELWAIGILIFGLALSSAITIRHSDIPYGLTVMWVYVGLLIQHLSPSGFEGAYPLLIGVLCISLIILGGEVVFITIQNTGERHTRSLSARKSKLR